MNCCPCPLLHKISVLPHISCQPVCTSLLCHYHQHLTTSIYNDYVTYTVGYITWFYLKPVVHLRNTYCGSHTTSTYTSARRMVSNTNVTGGTAGNKTVRSCSPCVITSQMFTLKHYSKKHLVIQYTLHCCACVLTQMQIKYFLFVLLLLQSSAETSPSTDVPKKCLYSLIHKFFSKHTQLFWTEHTQCNVKLKYTVFASCDNLTWIKTEMELFLFHTNPLYISCA